MHETAIFPLPLFNLTSPSCSSTRFPIKRGNFGELRTVKADIGLLNICMDFEDLWPKMGDFFFGGGEQNRGRGGSIMSHNELVFTFGVSYVFANFGEN